MANLYCGKLLLRLQTNVYRYDHASILHTLTDHTLTKGISCLEYSVNTWKQMIVLTRKQIQ